LTFLGTAELATSWFFHFLFMSYYPSNACIFQGMQSAESYKFLYEEVKAL